MLELGFDVHAVVSVGFEGVHYNPVNPIEEGNRLPSWQAYANIIQFIYHHGAPQETEDRLFLPGDHSGS